MTVGKRIGSFCLFFMMVFITGGCLYGSALNRTESEVISDRNINRLQPLAHWGAGLALQAQIDPSGRWLALRSSIGTDRGGIYILGLREK